MPKIKYESINFSQRSLKIIQQAESIVTDYKAKGYDLTLRQVYYQFGLAIGCRRNGPTQTGSTNNAQLEDAMAGLID
jgi:hypothetical protein